MKKKQHSVVPQTMRTKNTTGRAMIRVRFSGPFEGDAVEEPSVEGSRVWLNIRAGSIWKAVPLAVRSSQLKRPASRTGLSVNQLFDWVLGG